ncbi:hypothetical protein MRX96_015453 [Rhipicephalus microplus]
MDSEQALLVRAAANDANDNLGACDFEEPRTDCGARESAAAGDDVWRVEFDSISVAESEKGSNTALVSPETEQGKEFFEGSVAQQPQVDPAPDWRGVTPSTSPVAILLLVLTFTVFLSMILMHIWKQRK